MAGYIYTVMDPISFSMGFVITKIIALITQLRKEDMHMVQKAVTSSGKALCSYVKTLTKRLIASWEVHLPYRLSLLKSLCNPSEKVLRMFFNETLKSNLPVRSAEFNDWTASVMMH